MTRICAGVVPLLALLLIVGCGEDNEPVEGVDHDADYALEIKAKTFNFAEAWHDNPNEAQWLLEGLSEQLAAYETFPGEAYKETYAQLHADVQEIQSNYQQVTAAQIDELKAAAEELPGDPSTFILYD